MPSAGPPHHDDTVVGRWPPLTPWQRYAAALALVALATIARALINPLVGARTPFAFYFVAVVIAGGVAGVRAGVLTTLGCAASAAYFFVAPRFTFSAATSEGVVATLVFIAQGIFLAWLVNRSRTIERAHRTGREAVARRAEQLEFHGDSPRTGV
ncbi:MAG: DUF4118 domain-containing protein [Vicinamibacterales bacterium]